MVNIKKLNIVTCLLLAVITGSVIQVTPAMAQSNVLPAKAQSQPVVITNATIHIGNGKVIEKGTIVTDKGKIIAVGQQVAIPAGAEIIDASGKQVYPGLILPTSNLGLVEIGSIRHTKDVQEVGDLNPNVRAIVAYNTDSEIINTLRSNGILIANVVPEGGDISGTSSVVQLDAWNWDDAAYKMDAGIHYNMPNLLARRGGRGGFGGGMGMGPSAEDPVAAGLKKIEETKSFFREAKAYNNTATHDVTNLKLAAVKGLYNKTQKLYVHCNTVQQILIALDFKKEFGFDIVIVGGIDSWRVADILKQNDVPVILNPANSLPTAEDDDIDIAYKTAALLHKAGVVFTVNDTDDSNRGRNLAFNAGAAVGYGLDKEAAIQAITLNAAKILGVADKTGSIEVGKDANIIISSGDILDIKTSKVTDAFIQGRKINLDNKQSQLNERYNIKYGIKKPF